MNSTVRRVAVLGAGVMGAQIAAHLANADVPVILFDLAAPEGNANGIAIKALQGLQRMEPAPLVTRERLDHIDAANYDQHLDQLRECDLIIEAIAEKLELKERLYQQISPFVSPSAILATNTSGLPLAHLSAVLPANLRERFCGVHFFNPPRYMHLVELIPGPQTHADVLDRLEPWLVSRLGKGVIRAKDTPNFIANRIGVMWMLTVIHHTERLGLGFDEVDALTGPKIGIPRSATYRLLDVVGLDTIANVIHGMRLNLLDDPWASYFRVPAWLAALIAGRQLGQKTNGGIFRKEGRDTKVLDRSTGEFHPAGGKVAPEVDDILGIRDPAARLAALRASDHPQAVLLWSCLRDIFHYCAVTLAEIADCARDLDYAMRWGYGWSQGPFEMWQAAGWNTVADMVRTDIEAGNAMATAALPAWVESRDSVHTATGSWSASAERVIPRSPLPVYGRQIFPDSVLGESRPQGDTVWENKGVRLWRLPAVDPRILIASLRTKTHSVSGAVLAGLGEAVDRAEREFDGLVLWNEPPFAVGANLVEVLALIDDSNFDGLEAFVADFQRTAAALRYSQVPTVAAVQGMALGGGCEFLMQCAHRVVALESRIGLVEAGVGLIPSGGGCKELALRAAYIASQQQYGEPNQAVYAVFQHISSGKIAPNALEARNMGLLSAADSILFNAHEVLYVAIRTARSLAESGYHPPLRPRGVKVAGRGGIATLEHQLVNLRDGGFISAHDYHVARATAVALCGGEIETGSLVDEQWLLDVERRQFMALVRTPETRARIAHMLENGKPLRN